MAVAFHRCGARWLRIAAHPCWKVEKALQDAAIPYTHVYHPAFPRGKRTELMETTGQKVLPVIETEDGRQIRPTGAILEAIANGSLAAAVSAPPAP